MSLGRVLPRPVLPAAPWRDRTGALSPLRLAVLVALVVPAVQHVLVLATTAMAQPITATLHAAGRWALYALLASLAITPLRQALAWPRLIAVRRMIGVAAFAYAVAHFGTFVVDKSLDLGRVAAEIALRPYLAVGFGGLVVLGALAATSTDAMVRRLGAAGWQRLHRGAYLAAGLALIHQFQQSKADLWHPVLIAGLLGWLMLYRVVLWTRGAAVAARPATLAALTLAAAAATALGESAYLVARYGAPLLDMLAVQLDLAPPGPRPAAWIALAGALVALAAAVRRRFDASARGRGARRPASGREPRP